MLKTKTRQEVAEELKAFAERPIPDLAKIYDIAPRKVIVEFFAVREKAPQTDLIVNVAGQDKKVSDTELKRVIFPIVRVLRSGSETKFSVGDLAHVRDWDVAMVVNRMRQAMDNNPFAKGNMKLESETPAQMKHNFNDRFQAMLFSLDPLSNEVNPLVVCIDDLLLEAKINNVKALLNG